MRINPPIAVGVIIFSAFAALALNRHEHQSSQLRARCDVVVAYLRSVLAEKEHPQAPYFVGDFAPYTAFTTVDQFLRTPEGRRHSKDAIIPFLRDQEAMRDRLPLHECKTARRFLRERRLQFGDQGRHHKLPPVRADGLYRFEYIALSLPAIDPSDPSHAALEVSRASAPLGGGGFLVEMRRQRTGWQVQSQSMIWVS